MYNEFIYGFKTWFQRVRDKKNYESSDKQISLISMESRFNTDRYLK